MTKNVVSFIHTFMVLMKNVDFWVLPWDVLNRYIWFTSLLGCLVSNGRQEPPKVCYFRRFYHNRYNIVSSKLGSPNGDWMSTTTSSAAPSPWRRSNLDGSSIDERWPTPKPGYRTMDQCLLHGWTRRQRTTVASAGELVRLCELRERKKKS